MKKHLQMTLLALVMTPMMALAQQQFSTPEQAASALAEAISQHDESALDTLLGDNWQQFLPPDGIAPDAVDRFQRDWQVKHNVVRQDNSAWLDVGQEEWRLPIPIIKGDDGWHFDMAAAEDEILTRAIGRNELSAIQAMHAYVDAQQDFYQLNHAWAQKIISSDGKKDGLYWPATPGEAPSPLGPAFSPAMPGEGYHGYHFRIIPSDSEKGFALLAWPASWGETGVMSFIVSQDDNVYQADLGEATEQKAAAINRYGEHEPWKPVEE